MLYSREEGCEDPWLFSEAKWGSLSKKVLENTGLANIRKRI